MVCIVSDGVMLENRVSSLICYYINGIKILIAFVLRSDRFFEYENKMALDMRSLFRPCNNASDL